MTTFFLICHGLLAVFLLGALTHQVLGGRWTAKAGGRPSFFSSLRSVRAASYTNAIVVLYVIVALLGGIVYASYRVKVRPAFESTNLWSAVGIFELKEHFSAIGVGFLPAYWYYWKNPQTPDYTRTSLTIFLAFTVWWGFLVGHILNNIRGFGA